MESQLIYLGNSVEVSDMLSTMCESCSYDFNSITDFAQVNNYNAVFTLVIVDEQFFAGDRRLEHWKYFYTELAIVPILLLIDEQDLCAGLEGIHLGAQSIVTIEELLRNPEEVKTDIKKIIAASHIKNINRSRLGCMENFALRDVNANKNQYFVTTTERLSLLEGDIEPQRRLLHALSTYVKNIIAATSYEEVELSIRHIAERLGISFSLFLSDGYFFSNKVDWLSCYDKLWLPLVCKKKALQKRTPQKNQPLLTLYTILCVAQGNCCYGLFHTHRYDHAIDDDFTALVRVIIYFADFKIEALQR